MSQTSQLKEFFVSTRRRSCSGMDCMASSSSIIEPNSLALQSPAFSTNMEFNQSSSLLSTHKPMDRLSQGIMWFLRESRRCLTMPRGCELNYSMRYYCHTTSYPTQLPRRLPSPWYMGQTQCYPWISTCPHGDTPDSIKRWTMQD